MQQTSAAEAIQQAGIPSADRLQQGHHQQKLKQLQIGSKRRSGGAVDRKGKRAEAAIQDAAQTGTAGNKQHTKSKKGKLSEEASGLTAAREMAK